MAGPQQASVSRQCEICDKSFARAEHLERHKRIHTNDRPFPCPWCEQAFRRSDVRALHVKKSHQVDFNAHDLGNLNSNEPKRKRVKTACDLCRKRKLRCDGQTPCRQCQAGNLDCHYDTTTSASVTRNHRSNPRNTFDGPGCDSTSEHPNTQNEVRRDPQVQVNANEPESGPTPASGSTHTFHDPQIPQDFSPTAYPPEPRPNGHRGAIEMSSMMSEPMAGLDTTMPLTNDVASDLMSDFWQVPLLNGEAWWSEFDFDDNGLTGPMLDPIVAPILDSSPTQRYSQLMQEYFDRRSREPSPAPNKAASMWYSAPASLRDHDPEIMNVFLNLFARNVPQFFRLFEDLAITKNSRAEYVLAVTAVGALYCTTTGSFEFSKAMYNDSRRLLLAATKSTGWYTRTQPSYEEVTSIIKTYILNELYGLCSGDKRSYEFVEVFHQDLAKALQVLATLYTLGPPSPPRERQLSLLEESLHILDCYRVCILQRPPSFLWQHIEGLPRSSPGKKISNRIQQVITGLVNPGFHVQPEAIEEFSLASLSGLSPFLWNSMPLAPADKDYMMIYPKSDFMELAAEKWRRSHQDPVTPAAQILYHFFGIAAHTDLLLVQNYAHVRSNGESLSQDRDPHQAYIFRWVSGRHYPIAKWHSESILEYVERASSNTDTKTNMNSARHKRKFWSPACIKGELDIAHVPYAIYYATLVLWCGVAAFDGKCSTSPSPHLTRGRHLLSQQTLRIATLLEHVLRDGER